jgi:acyl carrier protein
MTVHQGVAGGAPRLSELAEMIREVTGQSREWAVRIGPGSRIEDDLELESIELATLGELILRRYGAGADLWELLAGLDFDELVALTVGDLLGFIARSTDPAPAGAGGGDGHDEGHREEPR